MDNTAWHKFINNLQPTEKKEKPVQNDILKATCPNGMQITLRPETEKDWHEVELLARTAFWKESQRETLGGIGADEHYLVHTFRTAPEFIKELDIIAEYEGKIIGQIMYTMAYVLSNEKQHPVIILGPLSVLPKYQKCGIGSLLMRYSLKKAAGMGYGAVFLYGHPAYYPRFGFKEAKEFCITTAQGENFPAFMAMEIIYGSLDGIKGSFHFSPLFEVDSKKAVEYDKLFSKNTLG